MSLFIESRTVAPAGCLPADCLAFAITRMCGPIRARGRVSIRVMTPNDFRRIALGMEGAIEAAHMGHPDFRVNGRIFATLHADDEHGMVKLPPDQQQDYLRASGAFSPAAGAWGRQGATIVRLDAIDEETLGEAMTLAWRTAVAMKPVKSRSTIAKSAKTSTRRAKGKTVARKTRAK